MFNNDMLVDLISKFDKEGKLLNYLKETDFFTAPASVRYHLSKPGGLAEHTYNVCVNLIKLNNAIIPINYSYSEETLIKVGVLASLSRVNFYELYSKNEKTPSGGWVAVQAYKISDNPGREQYGDMGFTSMMIGKRYVDLTVEEEVALCNYQHVNNQAYPEINSIVSKYPLTLLLFMAIQSAMYISCKNVLTNN